MFQPDIGMVNESLLQSFDSYVIHLSTNGKMYRAQSKKKNKKQAKKLLNYFEHDSSQGSY